MCEAVDGEGPQEGRGELLRQPLLQLQTTPPRSEEGLLLRQLAKRSAETNDSGDICISKISPDFLDACYAEILQAGMRRAVFYSAYIKSNCV